KQKDVLHFMVGQALESGGDAEHGNVNDDKEGKDMTGSRNVFQKDEKVDTPVLSHSDMEAINASAVELGSYKAAITEYALSHGIEDIEVLFPEATQLTAAPEFFTRRMEWVNSVLGGARKTPFSRIKT